MEAEWFRRRSLPIACRSSESWQSDVNQSERSRRPWRDPSSVNAGRLPHRAMLLLRLGNGRDCEVRPVRARAGPSAVVGPVHRAASRNLRTQRYEILILSRGIAVHVKHHASEAICIARVDQSECPPECVVIWTEEAAARLCVCGVSQGDLGRGCRLLCERDSESPSQSHDDNSNYGNYDVASNVARPQRRSWDVGRRRLFVRWLIRWLRRSRRLHLLLRSVSRRGVLNGFGRFAARENGSQSSCTTRRTELRSRATVGTHSRPCDRVRQ